MVLSVHTLFGGALGKVLGVSPAASFIVGVASHFLLDAIPHADYPIKSLKKVHEDRTQDSMHKDWRLAHDLIVNGLDGIVGFIVLLLFTYKSPHMWSAIAGGVGACVPDGLQFLHFMFPRVKVLAKFKKFHSFFHVSEKVEKYMEDKKLLAFCIQGAIAAATLYSIVHFV